MQKTAVQVTKAQAAEAWQRLKDFIGEKRIQEERLDTFELDRFFAGEQTLDTISAHNKPKASDHGK